MDQYCPTLPKLSHTSAKIGHTRIVACLVLFARWKTHSGHIFLKRKKKRKKEHNCEVQWHFHCNWWMTFNCPDFTSNIFINPNYQPIKKQFFFSLVMYACVSACVCECGWGYVCDCGCVGKWRGWKNLKMMWMFLMEIFSRNVQNSFNSAFKLLF